MDVQAEIVTVVGNPSVMFDGDLVSSWRVSPLAKGSTNLFADNFGKTIANTDEVRKT